MDLKRKIALLKRSWRKKKHPEYNAVDNSFVFFQEFADIYGDSINSLDVLGTFMEDFMTETKGLVIVDMLDADNWDCIRGYSIDKTKSMLYLYWRLKEKDAELMAMRKMAFPLDVYGLAIQFKDIQFIKNKKGKCFAICINGYTIPEADIRKLLRTFDPAKSKVYDDNSFFSTSYVRMDVDPTEDMRIMKTPIKSFWLIPKGIGINAQKSEEKLYLLNLHECETMVQDALKDCKETIQRYKRDNSRIEKAFKVAGNQMRQANENLFKLMMCFYQKEYNFKTNSYNDRLLGEAIGPIKKNIYTSEDDATRINKIATIANKCSHFTGLPVTYAELMELYANTMYYIGDFSLKVKYGKRLQEIEHQQASSIKSPCEYIKENYQTIDYSKIVFPHRRSENGKMSFVINFYTQNSGILFLLEGNYLCQDGFIHKLERRNLSQALIFWNREEVLQAKEAIIKHLSETCVQNGFDGEDIWKYITISIDAHQEGKPTHLFTEDEVRTVMAMGNDDHNNRLVIDEDGYPRLIQDIDNGSLYPVYQETWCAGENAVGATSSLYESHDSYVACMNCWLDYLKSGVTIYVDRFYSDSNIEEVIQKVNEEY